MYAYEQMQFHVHTHLPNFLSHMLRLLHHITAALRIPSLSVHTIAFKVRWVIQPFNNLIKAVHIRSILLFVCAFVCLCTCRLGWRGSGFNLQFSHYSLLSHISYKKRSLCVCVCVCSHIVLHFYLQWMPYCLHIHTCSHAHTHTSSIKHCSFSSFLSVTIMLLFFSLHFLLPN